MSVSLPWLFERDDYKIIQISWEPDYWCSNEGEFWYINRSLGIELELEAKNGRITQYHEKKRRNWKIKVVLDEAFGVGNHRLSTPKEVEHGGAPAKKFKKPKRARVRQKRLIRNVPPPTE